MIPILSEDFSACGGKTLRRKGVTLSAVFCGGMTENIKLERTGS
jgi:hypothetical protein